ncbi:ABC transporter ATP-binding protein [Myxococcus llanfairpwllgwyngyllgogerychwyrndrobwllllantysiliogogogochensis]|uniref:ABC transporter ATP-binding protein n=1 Tax=Myxococcus llanfairpwllgwyngyllgogerychwyrndrobwllllantysiliogogogochensis TaxID=2590453 RepID=A0A540X6N2_9BACT|nr:ABC transporter ATP-binding protein [Myxococcus llanfairpwllgwyngyllgogerychwyrndrobwllllantysiliogogogochensis]TQF16862.1 ABC transporter ATP-binding protein [Myxococcus llanfairpwllgwyngyllgogerychwyrndrobwllllantysiliogogogochensis]
MSVVEESPSHPPPGLRGLVSLLGLQGPLVGLAALSSTVAAALGLVPFFVVARMATAIYAEPPKLDEVRTLALVAVGALVLRYLFVAGATMAAHIAAFRILHALRLRIARKLGAVPLSFFSRRSTGSLKTTLMDDVNQIESFVAHNFPDAVAAMVVPLATAVALLWEDWRMALASIAVAPLAVGAMALAMRDVGKAHARWNEIQQRMNASLLEYFRGIKVIKTFGLSAARFGDLSRSIEEGLAWMEGFMRTNGRGYGAFGALIGSSLVVLVPLGGWLYVRGGLSLESLVLFLVLGPQLLMSLMRLMFAWGNVERVTAGNERIHDILLAPDLEDVAGTESPRHDGISFREVDFRYDSAGKDVLHRVTFDAPAGKVTALVGPSGAGKSTLVKLVPRLWEAHGGTVELGGVDVRKLPLDTLLSRVSMVFQDVFLFHGSVRDNLRLGRAEATDAELEAACRAARAHDFILGLPQGYDTMLGERGARLSGGEKQRLSIARALLKAAPVLLLDEATAFADPENEARIQEALSELCEGRTVVVVAHRLSTIATADHIVVLDGGRVQDQGPHEVLLSRCALYQRLWASHSDARDWSLGGAEAEAPRGVEVAS